jgi:hypothetical protein
MAMESESALVGGTRCAEKFDEAGQRDAEAHAADDELKCIDEARVSEFRALMQIEKAECRDDQRQDDTRHNVSRLAGHLESPGERDITLGGGRGLVMKAIDAQCRTACRG